MRPSYDFVWRTVGLWKSWSKYSKQAGTIGLVCLPFMNFWLLIDMCRHRAVWRAMEDQPIGRDVLRCPMGCGLKDFMPFSWLTCARRHTDCFEMWNVINSISGSGHRQRRRFKFGMFLKKHKVTSLWIMSGRLYGFFMRFQCFFLRIKLKFTWPKACWSHSRTRVLELSLTCPRNWSFLHATGFTAFAEVWKSQRKTWRPWSSLVMRSGKLSADWAELFTLATGLCENYRKLLRLQSCGSLQLQFVSIRHSFWTRMPHVYIEVWTRYPWRDGQASQQLRDLSATHTVQEEKADLPEDLAWDMSIHEQQSERDWELWIRLDGGRWHVQSWIGENWSLAGPFDW